MPACGQPSCSVSVPTWVVQLCTLQHTRPQTHLVGRAHGQRKQQDVVPTRDPRQAVQLCQAIPVLLSQNLHVLLCQQLLDLCLLS